jgi:hypothetical protein
VELYEEFTKFSKSEVLHFCKFEQQTETTKHDEAPRPPRYSDNQRSYPKQVIALTSMVVGHQRIGRRILDRPHKKEAREPSTISKISTSREVGHQAEAVVMTEARTPSSLRTACTTTVKPTVAQKIVPSFLSPKEKCSKTPNNRRNIHQLEK